ncbi:MAG: hypothetical protein PSV40_04275 [Polaromonas sp.]|uniref:hypothetical protein n=1 Tax=Polaromonas sp. TaxID=1869339 RepID=UPI002489ED43|nr:hypothetical protein [Polaromonas sp.]MDI1268302.1 hypothetical protein [Polaromonas sp.]
MKHTGCIDAGDTPLKGLADPAAGMKLAPDIAGHEALSQGRLWRHAMSSRRVMLDSSDSEGRRKSCLDIQRDGLALVCW